jgi:hypothetical protein
MMAPVIGWIWWRSAAARGHQDGKRRLRPVGCRRQAVEPHCSDPTDDTDLGLLRLEIRQAAAE